MPGETLGELNDEARAWELLAPWDVNPGNGPFDDVHGAGWRLITTGVETRAIDPATRTWFESIGGRPVSGWRCSFGSSPS